MSCNLEAIRTKEDYISAFVNPSKLYCANCRRGHVGMIAVDKLIEVYGRDIEVDAVARVARCKRCKCKGVTDVLIIYAGSSDDSMRTGRQANPDYQSRK